MVSKKSNFRHRCQLSLFEDSEFEKYTDGQATGSTVMSGGIRQKTKVSSEIESPIVNLYDSGMLKFMSFGSGSSGNCSYVGNENEGILIDAGITPKKVLGALSDNNIRPESLKGICLTHDHSDHIRYAYQLLLKYRWMHLYCTNRVLDGILRRHNISRRIKDYHVPVYKEIPFRVAGFEITAFDVPHDGSCNSGFFISYGDANLALATDIGSINERTRCYLTRADYIVLESNYDAHMLDYGTYPEHLKSRIRAANGHLDNADAAAFLAEIARIRPLKYVFLCHLSHDNNTPDVARQATVQALTDAGLTVGEGNETLLDRSKDVQIVILPRYDATRCYKFRVKGINRK